MGEAKTKKGNYQPGSAGPAEALPDGDRWTLVLVRELGHPTSKVWKALTDPSELKHWSPFDADRDLGATGEAVLTMVGTTGDESFDIEVRRAEPPSLLEYTWGEGLVRWELEALDSGTRLTLRHTVGESTWLPKVAAGWHICLDVAQRALAGGRIGRIVGKDARHYGWERLNAEYAEQFGVENTGWPEGID